MIFMILSQLRLNDVIRMVILLSWLVTLMLNWVVLSLKMISTLSPRMAGNFIG